MKWLVPILIIILCSSTVLADKELVGKIINFESTLDDGVCEGIENPLLNSNDCNFSDFLNSDWFIKLIILFCIIFIFTHPEFLQDKTAGILIGVFILILFFPMDNFINQTSNNTTTINESSVPYNNQTLINGVIVDVPSNTTPILILEKSPLEKAIDSILAFPKKLWPSHPRFALIIILIIGFVIYNELGRNADKIRYRR